MEIQAIWGHFGTLLNFGTLPEALLKRLIGIRLNFDLRPRARLLKVILRDASSKKNKWGGGNFLLCPSLLNICDVEEENRQFVQLRGF